VGKYLGPHFDIHGGGLDLTFPHHENEIAQSVAANGSFANYWMHNAWITMSGEKMSKSLGNTLAVREIVKRWRPVEVRYYLGAAHYRSNVEFSDAALDEAAAAYRRIEGFLQRAEEKLGQLDDAQLLNCPDVFIEAMNDDLAVPQALAAIHNAVRDGNSALTAEDRTVALMKAREILAMLNVLGLNRADYDTESVSDQTATIDALAQMLLSQRQIARKNKDFVTSDAIRDAFAEAGLAIEDTPDGPRWLPKEQ
jgi:cysteinyl-tRNA synthetase